MRVYVSTINFGTEPLSGMLKSIAPHGLVNIEVSSGHRVEEDYRAPVLDHASSHQASILLHNFAPPEPGHLLVNLSEPDCQRREAVVRFLKSRIDLTKDLGSDYYSFHGGYRVPYRFGQQNYEHQQVLPAELALEIFVDSVKEVVAYAESQGIHIGVENHVVQPGNEENLILYRQADFETLFAEIPSEFLHLHLDVGHLKVTCQTFDLEPELFIDRFKSKVMTVHLHDNDGAQDSHQPFDPGVWFLEYLHTMPQLRYACLETETQGDLSQIRFMTSLLDAQ